METLRCWKKVTRSKQQSTLRNLFSLPLLPPPPPPISPVLQEYTSWTSRNGAMQIIFLAPNRNMFAGKFVKWERLFIEFREHIGFSVNWVEVRKISEVLERNTIVKRVTFFVSFCWLFDFLMMSFVKCGRV